MSFMDEVLADNNDLNQEEDKGGWLKLLKKGAQGINTMSALSPQQTEIQGGGGIGGGFNKAFQAPKDDTMSKIGNIAKIAALFI